jgi:adenylate cyclase class 2
MGLKHHGYQENKRSLYLFEGAEISIDEWPQIPPYVEIEANTAKEVFMIAKKLGYNKGSVTGLNTQKVYEHYGMDLRSIEILKF